MISSEKISIAKEGEAAASPEIDKLTGVYGREVFYKLAADKIAANPDKCYDIVCGDIDGFSLVNDMFGHGAGDEALRAAARILSEFAGESGLCGRIGADVFCLLVERSQEYKNEIFEGLVSKLNGHFFQSRLNMSFGIYRCDNLDCSVNTACDRALLAAERIKGSFTELYSFYDDNVRLKRLRDRALTEGMETALKEKQFVVYYQPKYDLKTGEVAGAEALVRWDCPTEGLLYPSEFIPVFEQNGLITKLDCYVWNEVCLFIRECTDKGLPLLPISVNVSRTDLYNPELPGIITEITRKHGLEPEQMCLEITESACTERPELIVETVSRLSGAGFKIAMDDFGTGYSSLNMLSELPINALKLDMRLVQKAANAKGDVIGLAIAFAKRLNLTVIAEGIETQEQAQRLRDMDCDLAQGFFFCEPKCKQDYTELLVRGRA